MTVRVLTPRAVAISSMLSPLFFSSQGDGKRRDKLTRYIKHYHSTGEPFHVLFTVKDEPAIESLKQRVIFVSFLMTT